MTIPRSAAAETPSSSAHWFISPQKVLSSKNAAAPVNPVDETLIDFCATEKK
jgi:hypothetical protein